MNIRETREAWEEKYLSPYAALSGRTQGRDHWEEPCDIRTEYQRDRDRILHCKAFRRLKHKTQVFLAPEGDHYRTRLTHTLEVAQIARTIARSLRLNEDLTEAIALGHDLGHTPFGHSGEQILNELCPLWLCPLQTECAGGRGSGKGRKRAESDKGGPGRDSESQDQRSSFYIRGRSCAFVGQDCVHKS